MHATKLFSMLLLAASLAAGALAARAATPEDILGELAIAARKEDPRFAGFFAQRGREFFAARRESGWSCSTCHTANPLAPGKHAKTGKEIAPLAPAGDPRRFTDAAKVEKWFRRNCNDVLGRECTAQEKGDVLAYLVSLKK